MKSISNRGIEGGLIFFLIRRKLDHRSRHLLKRMMNFCYVKVILAKLCIRLKLLTLASIFVH